MFPQAPGTSKEKAAQPQFLSLQNGHTKAPTLEDRWEEGHSGCARRALETQKPSCTGFGTRPLSRIHPFQADPVAGEEPRKPRSSSVGLGMDQETTSRSTELRAEPCKRHAKLRNPNADPAA